MTDAIDYNALDDTLAGQLAQGGFIAAMIAVPDLITRRGPRFAAWAGLAALNVAAVGVLNATDEDPRNDLTAAIETAPGVASGPVATWVAIGAAASALVGIAAAGNRAFAGWLRGRGVDKPYCAMGLGAGLAYVAAKQVSA
ncbi:hypothetical protein SAMN04488535_1697 [Corynebacterium mycetoides]|uniref:Uncharacterized protein n=1 Tax=Corynebacterium mycetoides TaxID=38302 RepID=A0A1G9Q0L6_9CORY|nr:hypothetical protein [Corynebacterium mycetoides]SDM04554.1 hypothetical protein SAMN04488535_1697 [Corynebacterium mycetoides]